MNCEFFSVRSDEARPRRPSVTTPLLKKPGLDADELKNYRPVSNLSFLSKLSERAVGARLVSYLNMYDLMPKLQSAYRRHHSTKTALADVYAAVDRQQMVLLGLLDLSAAFDCVDHNILLLRLRHNFGIRGSAIARITSFLIG